jgi:hypothetical protein
MRLTLVPALKALDATEFYFRCDYCDYTSAQVTEITSSELVCDTHQKADFAPKASDLIAWCDREIAGLVHASGGRSEDQPPRATQLPPIPDLPPVDANSAVSTRDSIDPDKRMPAPMLRRPGYAMSGVKTFWVGSGIAAAVAGYLMVASWPPARILAPAPKLALSETRLVTLSPLQPAVPPSIELKGITVGSRAKRDAHTASLQPTTRSEVVVLDSENETTVDETNAMPGQFFGARGTAAARLLATRADNAGDVTTAAVNQAGLLFAESNVRYLTRAELEKLSAEQLRIARDEIFARKERYFHDHRLNAHFEKFAWYQPFVWHVRLNRIEQANVSLIRSLEASPTTRSVVSWRPSRHSRT